MQLTLMTVFGFLISFSLIVPGPVLRSVKGDLDGVFQQAPSVQKAQTSGDRGWPRGYSLPSEAQMVVYQPQIATWDNQKHAVGFVQFPMWPRESRNLHSGQSDYGTYNRSGGSAGSYRVGGFSRGGGGFSGGDRR